MPSEPTTKIGVYLYGFASIAAGIFDLIWGEFDPGHQPLQAWGDHIPGVTVFAYIAAVWLIAGGASILWRATARFGAAALGVLYAIFVLFPLPRFYAAPHYVGYRPAVYIGVMAGVCEQIILVVAAVVLYGSLNARGTLSKKAALTVRWVFGLCSVDFGLTHLTGIQFAAPFVPKWMPLGGAFWAVFTGVAFLLAGVAIVAGVLDVLAARLLGLMLLVFSVLRLMPLVFASPHVHAAWGANAYNLTAVGSAWIVAGWLATQQQQSTEPETLSPA